MPRPSACIGLVALLIGVALGQSTATKPTFEIADVHANPHPSNPIVMRGGALRNGWYELRKATMVDLIRIAYGVDADMVVGGPNWLDWDRFDVIAKAPPSTSPETVRLMLQSLLADRFKLEIHKDTKPMPGFAITVGTGKPKLTRADGSGDTGCQIQPPRFEPGVLPYQAFSCRNMTMAAFAQNLRGMYNAELTSPVITSPVVDSTGLEGTWNFDIKWTRPSLLSLAGAGGVTVFAALDKQLGLKLELQSVPLPVLVVDRVDQNPTGNPPGVLPVIPAEFEVASIRPTLGSPGRGTPPGAILGISNYLASGVLPPAGRAEPVLPPGGRVNIRDEPLKSLIAFAWGLGAVSDETLAGVPKWMNSGFSGPSSSFDIVAKVSTTADGPPIDVDELRPMMRALLVDRFKMVTHYEDRPVTAYTLMTAKPKLKKADPSNRTGCKQAYAAPPTTLLTCQNVTMAQFAERLQGIDPLEIPNQVLDATGIDGAWDFALTFGGGVGCGATKAGCAGQPADGASDPSSGVTLFEALEKQLGLKLEMHKRPLPVLVIDHIEEKPTEN